MEQEEDHQNQALPTKWKHHPVRVMPPENI